MLQILGAAIVLIAVVLWTAPRRSHTSMPPTLRGVADLVKISVDPLLLQTWASNVVAGNEIVSGSPNALPPFIRWIPAPCSPWTAQIHESSELKGLKTVELHSIGGFGSYGIVIAPQWWLDTYELSEPVAPGVYVRRYP